MHQHLLGRAFRLPLPTAILEVADEFLLLGVDRDDGLLAPQIRSRRGIDVLELGVAVGMRGALPSLPHGPEAIAESVEQPAHRGGTHLPTILRERRSELRSALARPPQWRHRVSAGERVHQPLQRGLQPWLRHPEARTPSSRAAHPPGIDRAPLNFTATVANRLPSQAGSGRNDCVPAVPESPRFGCSPKTARTLVEYRSNNRVFCNDGGFHCLVSPHASSKALARWVGKLVLAQRLR